MNEFLLAHGFQLAKGHDDYWINPNTGWHFSEFAMQFRSPKGVLCNFEEMEK